MVVRIDAFSTYCYLWVAPGPYERDVKGSCISQCNPSGLGSRFLPLRHSIGKFLSFVPMGKHRR